MRHDGTPPSGRVIRANDGYSHPQHMAKHWQGNRPEDCTWCQFEAQFPKQPPAPPIFVPAPASARETGGARALAFLVLYVATLATLLPGLWSAYLAVTNLGEVRVWHVAWMPLIPTAIWLIRRIFRLGRTHS